MGQRGMCIHQRFCCCPVRAVRCLLPTLLRCCCCSCCKTNDAHRWPNALLCWQEQWPTHDSLMVERGTLPAVAVWRLC